MRTLVFIWQRATRSHLAKGPGPVDFARFLPGPCCSVTTCMWRAEPFISVLPPACGVPSPLSQCYRLHVACRALCLRVATCMWRAEPFVSVLPPADEACRAPCLSVATCMLRATLYSTATAGPRTNTYAD